MGLLCLWRKSTKCSSSGSCYHCTKWNLSASTTHRWEVLQVLRAECSSCSSAYAGLLVAIHQAALLYYMTFLLWDVWGFSLAFYCGDLSQPCSVWACVHYECAFLALADRKVSSTSCWLNALTCFASLWWKIVKYWYITETRGKIQSSIHQPLYVVCQLLVIAEICKWFGVLDC